MIAYCYVVSVGEKISSAENIYHQGLLEEIKMEQRQHINALFQMIPKKEAIRLSSRYVKHEWEEKVLMNLF